MTRTIQVIFAVGCGAVITWVDSQPNWDDAGISALAILVTCGAFAFSAPKRWWLWTIAVGVWIPILGIARTQNVGSILALAVVFIGAFVGMLVRSGVSGKTAVAP